MRKSDLGEFKEVVLHTVAVLTPNAYSVGIAQEFEEAVGTTISTGCVREALQRLDNKGLVNSHLGQATQERETQKTPVHPHTYLQPHPP